MDSWAEADAKIALKVISFLESAAVRFQKARFASLWGLVESGTFEGSLLRPVNRQRLHLPTYYLSCPDLMSLTSSTSVFDSHCG